MSVLDLPAASRNAACDAIVDLLDGGGTIELQVSGIEVATLDLDNPFGNAGASNDGEAVCGPIGEDSSATGNASAVNQVEFKDSLGTRVLLAGGVGTAIVISPSATIPAGARVTIATGACKITMPAST